MPIKESIRAAGYAIGGGTLGLFAGSAVGAAYGAAVSATGTGILRAATNADHSMVSASAEMGALGGIIVFGTIGIIAGVPWGLSKGDYLKIKAINDAVYPILGGLIISIAPLVGGAIGQSLWRNVHDNQISSTAFFLFNLLGAFIDDVAAVVIGCAAVAVYTSFDCQPSSRNAA